VFCLDTNAVIGVLNESRPEISERLEEEIALRTPLLIPTIVLHELQFGIAKSNKQKQSQLLLDGFLRLPLTIIPFDEADAVEAADIRARLTRAGRPIGPYDLLIAAQARRRNAPLVTFNRREFERVPGLMVTDWGIAS